MTPAPGLVVLFETHATSLDNEAGLASGWYDVGLSARGEEQARQLGERRRGEDLAAVCCSDLSRAVRTAEIAFHDRALPIVRDRRLRECHYGTLTRHVAAEVEALRVNHTATPFPDGESYQDVVARVAGWISDVRQTYAGRTVLVIGHRATFYAFQNLIAGFPLAEAITAPWSWQPGWTYTVD
jgi:broad specificity phosphatase PhoE